jgi:hypothetical protein
MSDCSISSVSPVGKRIHYSFVFVTFGRIENQARGISQQSRVYPVEFKNNDERSEQTFLDEQGLNEELRSAFAIGEALWQEGRENATIGAGLGLIWRISDHMLSSVDCITTTCEFEFLVHR